MTIKDSNRRLRAVDLFQQITELKRFYGLVASPPADAFALFAWEVASLNAPPGGRDAAMAALRRFRALTPDAVRRAPRAALERAFSACGPSLDLRISAFLAGADVFRRLPRLVSALRGRLFSARRALRALPHLDPAGAHRMLLFAGGHAVMPVDSRVLRVAVRLGLAADDRKPTQRSVRRALSSLLEGDVDAVRAAFVYLSHHGAVTCTTRDPHCGVCPLLRDCPYGSGREQKGDAG
jgi:endonuclease III